MEEDEFYVTRISEGKRDIGRPLWRWMVDNMSMLYIYIKV
jgi:hypothetical protein